MQTPPLSTLLGGISPENFLQEYWQKKPLLIPQAWPGITAPLSPEELAGLACEKHVESRLVIQTGENYKLTAGRHTEASFKNLPDNHWTLLVSDLEKWLPELGFLLSAFSFLPAWRIDDLMISYAADAGNVGPHVDEYDVFLLQLSGKRQWKIGKSSDDIKLRSDCELAVLENFTPDQKWTLKPGDMLYLPPGVPHHGIAIGECMTASIGFRAPLVNSLAADYSAYLTDISPVRYSDPDLAPQLHSNEITDNVLARIKQQISTLLNDDQHMPRWAGEFLSSSEYVEAPDKPVNKNGFKQALEQGEFLQKNSWSKLLYYQNDTNLTLFADAVSYSIDERHLPQVQVICERSEFTLNDLQPVSDELIKVLHQLYQQGSLILESAT